MTGRQLIVYILENNLEDTEVFKDGKMIGFIAADVIALECGVGRATVDAYAKLAKIDALVIGGTTYYPFSLAVVIKAAKSKTVEDYLKLLEELMKV